MVTDAMRDMTCPCSRLLEYLVVGYGFASDGACWTIRTEIAPIVAALIDPNAEVRVQYGQVAHGGPSPYYAAWTDYLWTIQGPIRPLDVLTGRPREAAEYFASEGLLHIEPGRRLVIGIRH